MNASALSRSQLLATLVIEGAMRMITGSVQGKAPVEPVVLGPKEIEKLGVEPGRLVLFYPAEDDGVFFDMGGSTATVWFNGGDCSRTLTEFEAALRRAHPGARQIEDVDSTIRKDMRSRLYQVDFNDARVALLDIAYPKSNGAKSSQFAVRVFAQVRQN